MPSHVSCAGIINRNVSLSELAELILLLRLENWLVGGALRWVSNVHERYVTQ